MNKRALVAAALFVVAAACAFAAVATAVWIVRVGLIAPRAPVSAPGTVLRMAIAAAAAGLFLFRRDGFERTALIVSVVAAGSTALCGFGLDRPGVLAARLISHLVAYAMWAVIAFRLWWRFVAGRQARTSLEEMSRQ